MVCPDFVSSFVIVLDFVRFSHCNFYFYIVFVSQIVIVLVFVLTERNSIVLVFVFVTKIALHPSDPTHGDMAKEQHIFTSKFITYASNIEQAVCSSPVSHNFQDQCE